jgi:hypothetical protein
MSDKTVLILDSSQIDTFLTCPTLWHYEYQERLEPSAARENVPMDMGTYGHKLLEIIYKARARGLKESEAIDLAFAYDIDKETCRCSHGHNDHEEPLNFPIPKRLACTSTGCGCQDFVGVEFPLYAPDRAFVRDRVLDYTLIEGIAIPQLVPTSPEHVEVGFSYKIYEDDERLYILEGRIDLLGQIANNCPEGWADHKFQARERDLYLKSIQFRNYSMVTGLSLGVVNYIRFAKKIEKDKTFKRSIISFSGQEQRAWKENLIEIYRKIEVAVRRNYWLDPSDEWRNRSACSGKFGYPCHFTKLCENFFNPALIQIFQESEYRKKKEWRPW